MQQAHYERVATVFQTSVNSKQVYLDPVFCRLREDQKDGTIKTLRETVAVQSAELKLLRVALTLDPDQCSLDAEQVEAIRQVLFTMLVYLLIFTLLPIFAMLPLHIEIQSEFLQVLQTLIV